MKLVLKVKIKQLQAFFFGGKTACFSFSRCFCNYLEVTLPVLLPTLILVVFQVSERTCVDFKWWLFLFSFFNDRFFLKKWIVIYQLSCLPPSLSLTCMHTNSHIHTKKKNPKKTKASLDSGYFHFSGVSTPCDYRKHAHAHAHTLSNTDMHACAHFYIAIPGHLHLVLIRHQRCAQNLSTFNCAFKSAKF